jgi:hypothetical protein
MGFVGGCVARRWVVLLGGIGFERLTVEVGMGEVAVSMVVGGRSGTASLGVFMGWRIVR